MPERKIINLRNVDIKGGCLGCLQCGYESICVDENKGEFKALYNNEAQKADILVESGTIKDRYLSSRWKMFFDRSFFKKHQPTLRGKHMAMIVFQPLGQVPNLRQILELYPEFGQANLVGIVTDEYGSSSEIDALLQDLAQRMVRYADAGYIKPRTFSSVGGMKIFRDDIYGHMRFPFVADHRYYRKHGLYDFPQKKLGSQIFASMMILLTEIPGVRKEIYVKRMKGEMVKPFKAVLAH